MSDSVAIYNVYWYECYWKILESKRKTFSQRSAAVKFARERYAEMRKKGLPIKPTITAITGDRCIFREDVSVEQREASAAIKVLRWR